MGRQFAAIAFTPRVKAEQSRIGSRANYARVEAEGRDDSMLGAAEAAFIAARDSVYMASVSETGWPMCSTAAGHRASCGWWTRRLSASPISAGTASMSASATWPATGGSACS